MNHLPWPKNGDVPPPEPPYVCEGELDYDGFEYQGFPFRRGWSRPEAKFQWMNCAPTLIAKRAQVWLYFGLLKVFLGRSFRKQDFISLSHHSNSWILNSRTFPARFPNLVSSIKNGSIASIIGYSSREDLREQWNEAYLEAKLHLEVLNVHMNDSSASDEILRLVAAPIAILLQSLQRVAQEIFWLDDDPPAMCGTNQVPAKLSLWMMLDANRCQAQVGTFFQLYSPFLNHYVSGLPCHASQNDHEQCSWDGCVGNNVREASYKTQHVQQMCSCNFIGPDPHQLHHLVRNNAIPLVELNIVSGQPKIKLVPAQLGTRYVTLSHVWAGGLGNFKENRLPICQLLRLYDLLNRLDNFRPSSPEFIVFQFQRAVWFTLATRALLRTWALLSTASMRVWALIAQVVRGDNSNNEAKLCRPMYFWMDTLCVPVDPQESPLRRKAIGNMALIYAAGQRCLVLDPELQHISMDGLTLTQLNAHVLCSTWLTRSWTFQEAKLSREWCAQFEDGLYNPNCTENAALHRRLQNDWVLHQDDAHSLASEIIGWYHDMPAVRQLSITANQSARLLSDATNSFITVWNHLVSRSTSKMEDVHGIMANTLDLSAVEILALPVQERMKAILRTQESLPAALIYNSAPKINDTRCRWVPLYPHETYFSDLYGVLIPSTNGFLLDKSRGNPVGFLVDPSVPRFEKICLAESCGSSPLWITFLAEPDGPPVSFEAPGDTLKVCYVVGHLEKSTKYQDLGRRSAGARFALRKVEGKTLRLVYEYSFLYSHQPRKHFESRETFETISAERTDADAEFCVESG
ncbi:MAG: hypothetical protein L6R35_005819 [Caloplaca aegaea]|nr:MAG: hypothetical protein L6R35_005819 [Caloplaca aegaea]